RDEDILEADHAAARRSEALVRDALARDARAVERDEERGDAAPGVVARARAAARSAGGDRGGRRAPLPGDPPAAVDLRRTGLDVARVRAGAGLGEREADRLLTAEGRREPLGLDRVGREHRQELIRRVRAEERETEVEVGAADLLDDDAGLDRRRAPAAVGLGHRHAEVAARTGVPVELPEEL